MKEPIANEILALAERASNGELTSVDCARIEAILGEDPEARRLWIRAMGLDADLWLEAVGLDGVGSEGDGPAKDGLAPDGLAPDGLGTGALDAGPSSPGGPGRSRRASWRIAAAVAAALLVSAAGLWLLLSARPQVWGSEWAACVTRSVGARWAGEAGSLDGAWLLSGRRLRLEAGAAEVAFRSGARAILEAPASIEIESAHAFRLLEGRAVIGARGEEGFAVRTQAATVVPVGSAPGRQELGVKAGEGMATDVHVFRGQADVEPSTRDADEGSAGRRSIRAREGEALRVAPAGHSAIDHAPDAFLRNDRLTATTRRVAVRDDFADRIDPERWRIVLPAHDSAVGWSADAAEREGRRGEGAESDGNLRKGGRAALINRGYLVSAAEHDPVSLGGIRVAGSWRFAPDPRAEGNARVDILSVMTRADARVGEPYYEVRSGIEFRLLSNEQVPRIRALGPDLGVTRPEVHGRLEVAEGELLEFEAIDDGRELRFTVRKASDPSVSATARASVIRDASRQRLVVIHNRENPSDQRHVAYLEDVVIECGVGPCP